MTEPGAPPPEPPTPHAIPAAVPAASSGPVRRRGLERVTINLIPRASIALEVSAAMTGDNKTDCINRAVQIYAKICKILNEGGELRYRDADGDTYQLTII